MMKNLPDRLLIATKNRGKINEIRALLKDIPIVLLPLSSFPHLPDVLEDGETFRENALKKGRYRYDREIRKHHSREKYRFRRFHAEKGNDERREYHADDYGDRARE